MSNVGNGTSSLSYFSNMLFLQTNEHKTTSLGSNMISELEDKIFRVWCENGRQKRMKFLRHMLKISELVNTLIKAIPYESFPFHIRPISIDDAFEKRGEYAVDVYLCLDDFKKVQVKLSTKGTLTASVSMPPICEQNYLDFCMKEDTTPCKWTLSP